MGCYSVEVGPKPQSNNWPNRINPPALIAPEINAQTAPSAEFRIGVRLSSARFKMRFTDLVYQKIFLFRAIHGFNPSLRLC